METIGKSGGLYKCGIKSPAAGGIVTTWEGAPAQNGGRIIAAGDQRVHEAAIAMLKT